MHIQVTIISRLKAAMFEAKGRGKAAQREWRKRRKWKRRWRIFPFFKPPFEHFWHLNQSKAARKHQKKKKEILLLKCETVPSWSSPSRAAVINSERLLLHQAIWLCRKEFRSCCWAKIPVGSHLPQRHYSLTNVIAPFFPHRCCWRVTLFICRQFVALPSTKVALPETSRELGDNTLIQQMLQSCFCCASQQQCCVWGWKVALRKSRLTAWETKGFYFSPSRQSTDTLPHAVLHWHAEMGIRWHWLAVQNC